MSWFSKIDATAVVSAVVVVGVVASTICWTFLILSMFVVLDGHGVSVDPPLVMLGIFFFPIISVIALILFAIRNSIKKSLKLISLCAVLVLLTFVATIAPGGIFDRYHTSTMNEICGGLEKSRDAWEREQACQYSSRRAYNTR